MMWQDDFRYIEREMLALGKSRWLRGFRAMVYEVEEGQQLPLVFIIVSDLPDALRSLRNEPGVKDARIDGSVSFLHIPVVLIRYMLEKNSDSTSDVKHRMKIECTKYPTTEGGVEYGTPPNLLWDESTKQAQEAWITWFDSNP